MSDESRAADNLAAMRVDRASDWPHRLLRAVALAPLVPECDLPLYGMCGPRSVTLTDAERYAVAAAAAGMTAPEAATILGTSEDAYRTRLREARRKLRGKTTTHAVANAIRAGLIL